MVLLVQSHEITGCLSFSNNERLNTPKNVLRIETEFSKYSARKTAQFETTLGHELSALYCNDCSVIKSDVDGCK